MSTFTVFSQIGDIKGQVFDPELGEPIPFPTIYLPQELKGTTGDFDGNFILEHLPEGDYDVQISSLGYQDTILSNVQVTKGETTIQNIQLKESTIMLAEIEVVVSPLSKKEGTAVSLRRLSANELKYNVGGSLDISQVIKALPGINSTQGTSNELMVRGGSSTENAFFVDGIPMQTISHFSAQGSSGGIKSLLNLDLIHKSHVLTSGFPSHLDGGISGIFDFQLKNGNKEQIKTNALLSSNDVAIWSEGPLSEKVNFVASVRVAFLKFMMNQLRIPYASNYSDWNYKLNWELDNRRKISLIGIGGQDYFNPLSQNVHDDLTLFQFENVRPFNQLFLGTGIKYNQLNRSGFTNIILSNNFTTKDKSHYSDNANLIIENLILNFNNRLSDWRLMVDHHWRRANFNINFGGYLSQVDYSATINAPISGNNFRSNLQFQKYSLFAQANQRLLNRYLLLTVGLRIDGNTFSPSMNRPWQQFSPRLGVAYAFDSNTTISLNTGVYYQMPELLSLAYQNENKELVNKDLNYYSATHVVSGFERKLPTINAQLSIEAFYKKYKNYPFEIAKNTSLANHPGGYSRKGFTDLSSTGEGKAYGAEFFYQQQLYKSFYSAIAYTLLWSQSEERTTTVPTLADNRHNLSIRVGKHLKNNWHIGLKWQFQSGFPYTPADSLSSSLIANHTPFIGNTIRDYEQVNSRRNIASNTLDLRIDKTFIYKKMDLELFLDVTNVLQQKIPVTTLLFLNRDENQDPIINPLNTAYYESRFLDYSINTFLPTLELRTNFK